jgi:transposase
MVQDEARFGRISDPRRGGAPAGMRPEGSRPVVRQYEHAFAAISRHDGPRDSLVLPAVPAEAMSVFLAEVSRPHAGELMVMVLAGAGGHQAKRRQGPATMRLRFLPPGSPPLNPLEHLWDEGREKGFANRVFARRKAVEKQLITALKTLQEEPTRGASLTGFAWISSTPLNAH